MLFAVLRPARALVLAYLVGWMVLPVAEITVAGFPNFEKGMATSLGAVAGVLVFCPSQFKGFKLRFVDAVFLVFCACTGITSLTNGLGPSDGLSNLSRFFITYGIPYFLARAILRHPRDFLSAARTVVCASAIYAVFALWEWRMAPHLHNDIYGTFQHSWAQHSRWGFWRPIVCFTHALALGIFFTWTALLAIGLYWGRQLRPFIMLPAWALVVLPLAGLMVSMSIGPWLLFAVGLAMMVGVRRFKAAWLMLIPLAFAVIWMGARYSGLSDGQTLSRIVAEYLPSRQESFDYRLNTELLLVTHARERPVFGWGTWGRNFVKDELGGVPAADGLWVILVGSYGLAGLCGFYLWWSWPIFMTMKSPAAMAQAPALIAIATAIALQSVNLLFNGFLSPVLILMCGASVSTLISVRVSQRRQMVSPQHAQAGWVQHERVALQP